MPTRYAHPPHMPPPQRQYRNNIRRKGYLEVEMIWESEAVPMEKKPAASPMNSPVSVFDSYLPEIKPLALPDSWTVVGKNGKPLKGKMYDEPRKAKKKKSRKPKVVTEAEPLADLVETPSSSKCLHMSDLSNAKHGKEVTRARNDKYWHGYRDAKEVKKEANRTLVAMFSIAEHAGSRAGMDEGRLGRRLEKMEEQMVTAAHETMAAQDKEHRKSNKGCRLKEKTRRAARSNAAAARCYALKEDNEYDHVLLSPRPKKMGKAEDVNDVFWSLEMHSKKTHPQKQKQKHASHAKDKGEDVRKRAAEMDYKAGADMGDSKQAKKKYCSDKAKKSCNLM